MRVRAPLAGFPAAAIGAGCLLAMLALPLGAQSFATSNTDPIWTPNIFHANPPVLTNDPRFIHQMQHAEATCYSGSNTADRNCYLTSLSSSLTLMNKSANDTFTQIVLLPAFTGLGKGRAGDFVYIFQRLSDYFPGTRCTATLNREYASCVIGVGPWPNVPYSFVTLPVSTVFNPGSALVSVNPEEGSAPEPGTLWLVAGGAVLILLGARSRRRLPT